MAMRTGVYGLFLLICPVFLLQAQPATALDQIVKPYVESKRFMGTALVAKDGRVLLDKGYGSANLEWNIANTPEVKFRLGSITKQFTAASVLLLEQRGKLKLDAPVKTYYKDAPTAWDKVTIFHLLTHTSGIPNFTSFPEYRQWEPFPTTPEKLVLKFRDRPLDFEPGAKWSYSNSGYILLGWIIEDLSAQSYSTFLKENIFGPLGMTRSGIDSNTAIISQRADGYVPAATGPAHAGFIHMSVPHAGGSLYSTTGDLLRWEQGLFGGKVLNPESLRKMTTPFKNNYAFGLAVETLDGHKVIQHGGGIEGFNTFMSYFPDDKLVVIVLANLNGNAPEELAKKLASAVLREASVAK